jgi:hypothetical protein
MSRTETRCSPIAVRCLDRQLGEALDLAVSCRVLSGWARAAGQALTAVALERLSTDLMDQAAVIAPLVPHHSHPECPAPAGVPSPGLETCLADLDHRLSRAALVAQSDAMSPDLEAIVIGLLWSLAALYHTRRELLLVCTLLDSA